MDLKLDSQGDLAIESGDLVILSGVDAIAQHLKIRLRFFLGEWFLNLDEGIPYFERVFVKSPNIPEIRALYRRAILTTPGVATIDDLTVDFDGSSRVLSVTFAGETDTGEPLDFSEDFIL